VRGVADQRHPAVHLPRRAAHRPEHADRVVPVVVDQVRHQRHQVGVDLAEVAFDRGGAAQRREGGGAAGRPEQRAGERPVRVRQRDHHRAAARPDVQGARVEREVPGDGRDAQFLVAVVEEVQGLGEPAPPAVPEELAAHRRPGAVRPQHDPGVGPHRPDGVSKVIAPVNGSSPASRCSKCTFTSGASAAASSSALFSAPRLIELIARSPSALYGWKPGARAPGGSSVRASAARPP
jgi:hypothetical protein